MMACACLMAWLVVCISPAGSAAAAPAPSPSPGGPVARAVLFYSPTCQRCDDLIRGYLPYLMNQYGDRLQILSVNAAESPGTELFQAAVAKFDVPVKDRGVPAIVIGDHFLSGALAISRQMPKLVAQSLVNGDVGWPAVPGLSQTMTASGAVTTSTPSRLLAVTEQPDGVLDRFLRDRWGNTVALIVLAGMLMAVGTVIWQAGGVWPSMAAALRPLRGWRFCAGMALTGLGVCVAGYLAYVEGTHAVALCGPVGDCNAVQQSTHARLFGVLPVAYAGMGAYLLIGVAFGLSRLASEAGAKAAVRALLLLTLGGTLFSIYLTVLEPFVIGATCAWCLSSAVIMTLLFVLCTSAVRANRGERAPAAAPSSDVGDTCPPGV